MTSNLNSKKVNESSVVSKTSNNKNHSVLTKRTLPVKIKRKEINWKEKIKPKNGGNEIEILTRYLKEVNNVDKKALNYDDLAYKSKIIFLEI